jgi:hypothetical protein
MEPEYAPAKRQQERTNQMTTTVSRKLAIKTVGGVSRVACLALLFALAVSAPIGRSAEAKADAKSGNQLIGTWKLVSAKYGGDDFKFEEGITTLKHVTPSQFMWASYDKNGTVTRAAGGGYTLKGDVYEETPEYGLSSDFEGIKAKAQTFTWRVEGNKWYHTGKLSSGLTIDEVWERVEKK